MYRISLQYGTIILLVVAALSTASGCASYGLIDAARHGNVAKGRELIDKGIDVNIKYGLGELRPITTAARSGQSSFIVMLIEKGVDVNQRDGYGMTALDIACFDGNQSIARILLKAKADPTLQSPGRKRTSLHWAGAGGHYSSFEPMLQEHGASAEARDDQNRLPKDMPHEVWGNPYANINTNAYMPNQFQMMQFQQAVQQGAQIRNMGR